MVSLITEHIDIWTAAQTQKTNGGKGRGKNSNGQSPHGIKKLRELILELAVRGKLMPQDPSDEPARALLENISKEKARLIKEGKIKKQKLLPEIGEDEKPFDLPVDWEWARLGDVTNYGISDKAEPNLVDEDTWVLELEDVEKETSKLLQKVRFADRQFRSSKNRFYKGDVIYGKLRPYLDKVIIADEDGVCTTEMIPLKGYDNITPQYLRLVMKSPYFIWYANESTHGMNLPRMGTDKARLALFPMVSEGEQHRIVAKVDELMALCDQLEQQQTDSNAIHRTLVETLLSTLTTAADQTEFTEAWQHIASNFDKLFATEQSLDQLKQTILQLAVMGKLVLQDAKNEPASVLLEKIAKEKDQLIKERKIKKQKPLPEITDDERPFELPEGWKWARLHNLVFLLGDGLHGTPNYTPGTSYYFVNGNNLNNGRIEIKPSTKTVSFEEMIKHKKDLSSNAVLVSINGTLGNVAFYNGEKIILGKSACYFNLSEDVFKRFIKILIESQYFMSYALRNATGTTIKNLSLKAMNGFPVPLPPLAEQHCIVAKVDELMALCDTLKTWLNHAETIQVQLADAIVELAVVYTKEF